MRLAVLNLLFALNFERSIELSLEGSPVSYARYPKWSHTFENVLSFEFSTFQPDALLFYTDDGGTSNFFELLLINGNCIRLTFRWAAFVWITVTKLMPKITTESVGKRTLLPRRHPYFMNKKNLTSLSCWKYLPMNCETNEGIDFQMAFGEKSKFFNSGRP